jgi:hypothetical protein
MRKLEALTAAVLCLAGGAHAQSPAPRSEVPIREMTLSNGVSFYSIPIKVGGTVIEAGLDTGSTGVRVLPGTLASEDAVPSRILDLESFGIGTEYRGSVGRGTLAVGDLAEPVTLQLIRTVGCRRDAPQCPAARVSPDQFRIMGLGLPGEGFRAMMGIGMREAEVQSPLPAIGATRWIVELPLPGTALPGRLILNPGDDEIRDFARLPTVAGDSVRGCILSEATNVSACGAVLMDTGSTAMAVFDSRLDPQAFPQGTVATLTFHDTAGPVAVERFEVGRPSQASGLSFQAGNGSATTMNIGRSPYFAFDVLYVPGESIIGLRPRPPAVSAPTGALADILR